jgi:phosphoglycerate dehydrogenase-like enzyme
MRKAAFFCNDANARYTVFGAGRWERINHLVDIHPAVVSQSNIDAELPHLAQIEVILSTWGMFVLTPQQLARLPQLKVIFYAAGSVKRFAAPLLEAGVTVVSSWAANAVPTAEFAMAQILLANKGYHRNLRDRAFKGRGNFGSSVAIIGAGMVGSKVIELLGPFELDVIACDPYLSQKRAAELGVELVSLEEAFKRASVVSNHAANIPETVGMLRRDHFSSMQQHASFVNTGRGASVVEEDLIAVLQERPDLTALLDVTWPEPPVEGSVFYSMPNVVLSGHLAGSCGDEVMRMADYAAQEMEAWLAGRPLRYEVTPEMLDRMA